MVAAVLSINTKVCEIATGLWALEWLVLGYILLFIGVHLHFASFVVELIYIKELCSYGNWKLWEFVLGLIILPVAQAGFMFLYFLYHTWPTILIFVYVDLGLVGLSFLGYVLVKIIKDRKHRRERRARRWDHERNDSLLITDHINELPRENRDLLVLEGFRRQA